MDLVKKNWISVTLGVIALLAVAATFYPLGGMQETLRKGAAEHAQAAETLKTLKSTERFEPISSGSEPVKLSRFPTPLMVEAAQSSITKVNDAAEALMQKSNKDNAHLPLVQGSLPGGPGLAQLNNTFAREYLGMFPPAAPTGIVAAPPAPIVRSANVPTLMDLLKALNPPSVTELELAREATRKKITDEETQYGPDGQPSNALAVQARIDEECRKLADKMRSDVAAKCLCYVAPNAFAIFMGMTTTAVPTPSEVFWAQVGLWAQEDICKAIYEMNKNSANVMEAPIKEVWQVSFPLPGTPTVAGSQATQGLIPVFVMTGLVPSGGVGTSVGTVAAPVMSADGTALPPTLAPEPNVKNFPLSPTGRQSNSLYDVLHFDVELIVDSAKVPQVMEALGVKQYITVIQLLNLEPVDSAYHRGLGNYFGEKPCVKVRVRCEQLFFRNWLEKLVPKMGSPSLKEQLGYPPPPVAG